MAQSRRKTEKSTGAGRFWPLGLTKQLWQRLRDRPATTFAEDNNFDDEDADDDDECG